MKYKCPYKETKNFCSHRRNEKVRKLNGKIARTRCGYIYADKCPLYCRWKDSLNPAERLIFEASNRFKTTKEFKDG
jgi:hypothetical protein